MMKKMIKFKSLILCLFLLATCSSTLLATASSAPQETALNQIPEEGNELTSQYSGAFSPEAIYHVTLITGDTVSAFKSPTGKWRISVTPANPLKTGQNFQTIETPEGTYVIPSSINLEQLDIEFFNIDYLIENEYYKIDKLPIIISTKEDTRNALQSVERDLRSHNGVVTTSSSRLSLLSAQLPVATIDKSVHALLDKEYVKKIWLDKKLHVCLSDSVPLIGAPELWDDGYDGTGVTIAILDTGIDSTHPSLDDLDDNPATTDHKVVDAIDFSDDGTINDLDGHGTHCAGIAAGTGGGGLVPKGVAPGALLWNVKVLNQFGWGLDSWIIEGIEYAAFGPDGIANTGDEADILSMSFGGSTTDGTDPLSLAVDAAVDAGAILAISAGIEGEYFQIGSPGVAQKAITVGASTKYDNLAYFSSMGPTIDLRVKPDVVAPGVSITSSVPYDLYGTYSQSWSGTSMATPHVAGTAALLLQKGVPAGWATPDYVKNTLISTAVDLGYNVYEQGGGRISAPSAAYTEILVDPATVSFGLYEGDTLDSIPLTFYNLNPTSSRILSLSVFVEDIYTGALVNCALLNTTLLDIAAGSQAAALLTINTTSLDSIYSGQVIANIDNGETVHVIFGFVTMNKLTVSKVDMSGAAAAYDDVYVIGDSGFPSWSYQELNADGVATFYVSDGTYQIVSIGFDWDMDSTVYTVAENVEVTQGTDVYLDERDTVEIGFDANKPAQIFAETYNVLLYDGEDMWAYFSDIWFYPTSASTYISPTSFDAGFTYSYYPEAYYNLLNPFLINTPEWHKLLYTLQDITGSVTFLADYNNLVKRTTDYKVALMSDVAERVQFVYDPIAWFTTTYDWQMNAPQSRVEWLSPEPAVYEGWYSKSNPQWDWDFSGPFQSYPIGETYLAFGEHPLTSGVDVDVDSESTGSLYVSGRISTDTFGNIFANYSRYISGSLTLIQDGFEVFTRNIWDSFWGYHEFAGTPGFNVIIEGNSALSLSTSTRTELSFIADSTQDYKPPKLVIRPRNLNLFCIAPSGNVLVDVNVLDDSPVAMCTFEYSLNDGTIWQFASLTKQNASSWVADLGILESVLVSIRVTATDTIGNRISQTTIRGLSVEPQLSAIKDNIFYAPSNTVYFVKTGNIWDDSTFYAFYAYKQNPQNIADSTQNEIDNEHFDGNGMPLFTGNIVTFGGRIANRMVRYFEDQGAALVGYEWNGTHHLFKRIRDGVHLYAVDGSTYNENEKDYFVFQIYLDGDRYVLSEWGIGAKGTYAGGTCFIDQIWPNIDSYDKSYYIYSWTDLNGNNMPESAEIVLEASGS